jgi:hypothetical protein
VWDSQLAPALRGRGNSGHFERKSIQPEQTNGLDGNDLVTRSAHIFGHHADLVPDLQILKLWDELLCRTILILDGTPDA